MTKKELIAKREEIFSQVIDVVNQRDYIGDATCSWDKTKRFYIVESWSTFKRFNETLKELVPNIRRILPLDETQIKYYKDGDWDTWFDFMVGDNEWGFADEWDYCCCCGTAINIYPTYDTVDGYCDDGGWVCGNCVRNNEDSKSYYLDYITDKPNIANTILSSSDLIKLGYEEVHPQHSSGWYDYNDNVKPESVFNNIKRKDNHIIFSIDGINMFETRWSTWVKEEETA